MDEKLHSLTQQKKLSGIHNLTRKDLQRFIEQNIEETDLEELLRLYYDLDHRGQHISEQDNIRKLMCGVAVEYREEYGPLLIYHCSLGHSISTFGARIGVPQQFINQWASDFEDFAICVEMARDRQKLKWEGDMADVSTGKKKGNAAALTFGMKNYFPDDFKDRRELETAGLTIIVDTGISRTGKRIDGKTIAAEFKQLSGNTPRQIQPPVDDDNDFL